MNPGQRREADVRRAAAAIRAGGVLLSPTDTVYGLACDPFDESAVRRIVRIKGRSPDKGFLVLIGSLEWAERLGRVPPRFGQLARRIWPGPVTVLLEARAEAPRACVGREGKIGLRAPRDGFLEALLAELDAPLLSTSANRSGQPIPPSVEELALEFEGEVDAFVRGSPPAGLASSVVDLTVSPPAIVRRGHRPDALATLLHRWRGHHSTEEFDLGEK